MQIKKFFRWSVVIILIIALAFGGWLGFKWLYATKLFPQTTKESEKPLWLSDHPTPKTVEPGAYLATLNAVAEEDLERAASLYLKVLAGDPTDEKIQREAYFFNAILGNFDALRPVVEQLSSENSLVFLTDYVKMGYAFHDKQWSKVREDIEKRQSVPLDEIVNPLVIAWSYAAQGNYKEAMQSLEPLKNQKGLLPYYYYHQALIALTLGKDFDALDALQNLSEGKLLTLSMYPEIRFFLVRKGEWRADNPFYVKWQLFSAEQPAAAELIMQRDPRPMTAMRGAAEVFYNLSTAMGSTQTGREGALILSALSLYLNPDQNLPQIWSAEILEQEGKPQFAAHYYGELKDPITQTVEFKRANNLIACGREKEALPLLLKLEPTNRDSTQLWLALANIYQKEKNWTAARHAYTRILEIEGESNRAYASDIYFARAFIYSEQNQQKKAESDLKKALELNPDNPMLLNHLGYQWLEHDQTLDKGFELVEKAYKLRSTDPHIIDSMAYAYYRKAEHQKALPLAEKTVDIMPQSSVANAHLGDIYEALGRHREAIFQYRKALALKYDLTPELKEELSAKIAQNKAFVAK